MIGHLPLPSNATVFCSPFFNPVSTSRVSQQAVQPPRIRTHLSERHPVRGYTRPIPHQSTTHLAIASAPRDRSVSVAIGQVTQSHLSSFGSALFASSIGQIGSLGADINSAEALADTGAPVIVELPHESITVEDYARPLYRKDIFFPWVYLVVLRSLQFVQCHAEFAVFQWKR